MEVRNKFCAIKAAAMENDIIAEGFLVSEQMYELRYMSVVTNGDSSMIETVWQMVSYGIFMNKINVHIMRANWNSLS